MDDKYRKRLLNNSYSLESSRLVLRPLMRSEESRPVRIRASCFIHAWLRTLTAAEIGTFLSNARASPPYELREPISPGWDYAMRHLDERTLKPKERYFLLALRLGAWVEDKGNRCYIVAHNGKMFEMPREIVESLRDKGILITRDNKLH